jgi:hypothetical protein
VYSTDFYNDVAEIAVVLMFTKVVSHGVRKIRAKHAILFLHPP